MESHTCDVCLQTIWRIVLMTEKVQYPDLVVVGAGLFGLTVAQQAVEHLGVRVEIIDVR
ncbi:NAD(P)-binding protein, partial [Bifidobacterium dentium]